MSVKLQLCRMKKSWRSVSQQCEYTTELYILNGQDGKFCGVVFTTIKKKIQSPTKYRKARC